MSVLARSIMLRLLIVAGVVITGCAADQSAPAPGSTTLDHESTVTSRDDAQRLPERIPGEALAPKTVTGEVPPELLAHIIGDAAARSGVAEARISVVTGQEMLWPDGSLGCAEPGELYTQAQVPGYWVVLQAGGAAYDYRLDSRGFFKLCTSPLPGPGDSNPTS